MKLTLLCLLIATVVVGSSCRPAAAPVAVSNRPVSVNDRPTSTSRPASTKPLAEMTWTDEKGGIHKVSELQGKAVVLDFWATYCPPCREEIPHLNSLLAKNGPDNIAIVGMHVGGDEDKAEIPKFTKQTKLDYPLGFPEDALAAFVFGNRDDIPQTLVLDRNGQVVDQFAGFGSGIQRDLDAAVEKALSN
ncbi:MAG TPA: TlpA disulfide reductase family protein [Pyrinomonadaceae bacterium]|nr:TlpA disulfide reductase family protein [Pyrinomonadaceae bacterium]